MSWMGNRLRALFLGAGAMTLTTGCPPPAKTYNVSVRAGTVTDTNGIFSVNPGELFTIRLVHNRNAADRTPDDDEVGDYLTRNVQVITPNSTTVINATNGQGSLHVENDIDDATDSFDVFAISNLGDVVLIGGETTSDFFPDDKLPGTLPAGTDLDVRNEVNVFIGTSQINGTVESVTATPAPAGAAAVVGGLLLLTAAAGRNREEEPDVEALDLVA